MTALLSSPSSFLEQRDCARILSVYVLGKFRLSQTVGGIRLSQGKEIYPILSGQGACPRNLGTVGHVCDSTAFYRTLKMFADQPMFCRSFRTFVTTPSVEMTKGHIDMLLSFQTFFISRAKFSFFVNFSASVLGTLRAKGIAISITSAVLLSIDGRCIGSAEI